MIIILRDRYSNFLSNLTFVLVVVKNKVNKWHYGLNDGWSQPFTTYICLDVTCESLVFGQVVVYVVFLVGMLLNFWLL
jgi:hypothetical protein